MDSDRFQRVMAAFERASVLPQHSWEDFAHREFPDDLASREELLELLGHHDKESSLVGTGVGLEAAGGSAGWGSGTGASGGGAGPMPKLRGNYRILRTIGEGGMGVVFEAEQDFPRRRVALKALRPGLASQRMLRRFRNEAEILARLQHPHIAQIYDAGVADESAPDHAYFAMELVRGTTLTAYARERGLSQRQCWEVLLKVCDAVQHAHQRGVIHRDLKPANILVDESGEPKVVDFGVARASEGSALASMATRDGQLIGTPAYMSPEQLRTGGTQLAGAASVSGIDTRSDIYALGVVAYELLTGRLPFDIDGLPILRAGEVICTTDPPPPSRFDRSLRGDPEVIIAKAMAKEPGRRYASAAELAQDIQRMLHGEAILARRDSALYVLGKQVRRHRAASAVALVVLLSLVGFAIFASISAARQARLAQAESQARAQAQQALRAAEASSQDAQQAQRRAEAAQARALEELAQATIERGRLNGLTGNLPLAEDILWNAYFDNPSSRAAYWGLWDLYDKTGSEWVTRVAPAGVAKAAAALHAPVFALATADTVVLVDATRGGVLATSPRQGSAVVSVAILPDATRVFAGTQGGGIRVLDAGDLAAPAPMTLAGLPDKPPIFRALAMSEDGELLAGGASDNSVWLWRANSGELVRVIKAKGQLRTIALSSTAGLMAYTTIGEGEAMAIAIVRTDGGESVYEGAPFREVAPAALAFSPDGKTLYFGAMKQGLVAWDVERASRRMVATSYLFWHSVLSVSPDGSRIFAGDDDVLRLLDTSTGQSIKPMPGERFLVVACWWEGNDAITIVTADGLARRLDLRRDGGLRRLAYDNWSFEVTYSRDGSMLAVSGGVLYVDCYDALTLERISRCELPRSAVRVRAIEVLSDNRTLVAGSADGKVRVIDGYTGLVTRELYQSRSEVFALAIDPHERVLAVGLADRSTTLLDLRTGEHLCNLPAMDKRVEGLAFSHDGSVLVISGPLRGVALWDMREERLLEPIATSAQAWNTEFSPDGNTLYVTTQGGSIDVIDWATRSRRTTAQGHQRLAPGLAVSHDGQFVATAGEEGLINLWDASSMRVIATFKPQTFVVVSLDFSPDGRWLAASTAGRETVVYDLHANDARVRAHEAFHRQRLGRGVAKQ